MKRILDGENNRRRRHVGHLEMENARHKGGPERRGARQSTSVLVDPVRLSEMSLGLRIRASSQMRSMAELD
jgi:hypothetical protein